MGYPSDNQGRCLGSPPDYSEDDYSSSAQASEDDQDASTHQDRHYDYQDPSQQPTQQMVQPPVHDPREQFRDSDEDSYWGPASNSYSDSEDMEEDSVHGRSQPYVTSQMASTWAREQGLPDLPMPNPFGSAEQPITGFERPAPGDESRVSLAQEWEVRMGVAQGQHITEIARRAQRDASVVEDFIAANGLMWTPDQDEQLTESVNEQDNMSLIQEGLIRLGSPIRSNDEVQARVQYLVSWGNYARRAELAATHGPDPQQYPAVCQPGEMMQPQAPYGAPSKTDAAPEQRPWTADETENLEAFAKPGLSPADLSFIKNENAKGFPVSEIVANQYPGYSKHIVFRDLHSSGWAVWTRSEDQQVLKLQQQEGDEWAQISNEPDGVSRSRQEVKIRYELLTGALINAPKRKAPARPHDWDPAEDEGLELKLAQGINCNEVAKAGFYGLTAKNIRHHATHRGYYWGRKDDQKLQQMNFGTDALVDWDSIGRQYIPERKGHLVKLRWEFLHPKRQEELEDIKLWIARGYTYSMMAAKCYPQRTARALSNAVVSMKYQRWTDEQDRHLLELKAENNGNWAEIRRKLCGPERSIGEILQRLWLLTEGRPDAKSDPLYLVDHSIDEGYVRLRLARGVTLAQIAWERFRGMGLPSLERFAATIGATWSEEDDQMLRDKVLVYGDYGLKVDWQSIGQQYDPARPADIVETHWKYLRGLL